MIDYQQLLDDDRRDRRRRHTRRRVAVRRRRCPRGFLARLWWHVERRLLATTSNGGGRIAILGYALGFRLLRGVWPDYDQLVRGVGRAGPLAGHQGRPVASPAVQAMLDGMSQRAAAHQVRDPRVRDPGADYPGAVRDAGAAMSEHVRHWQHYASGLEAQIGDKST